MKAAVQARAAQVAWAGSGYASSAPATPRRLPQQQARPLRLPRLSGPRDLLATAAADVELVLLPDCSGSEYGAGGDSLGYRFAVGRALVELMRTTGGGRVSLVHWGSRPVHAIGPVDVRREARALHRALIADPGSMGGNDFPAALRTVPDLLSGAPSSIPLVLATTDGLEDVTPAMAAAVDALPPGSVHVLLVPGDACDDALAARWEGLSVGSFTRLPSDHRVMASAVGSLYAAAVGGRLPALPDPVRFRLRRNA